MNDNEPMQVVGVDLDQLVMPVVSLVKNGQGELAHPSFYGTAFAVAPGMFVTAAHVITDAGSDGVPGLGFFGQNAVYGRPILDVEIFEDLDCAFVRAAVPAVPLPYFVRGKLRLATDVTCFGYAFAVDKIVQPDIWLCTMRAFKGHVVTRRKVRNRPGEPRCYELSCPCPAGMSGAPVLLEVPLGLVVVGIVLGEETVQFAGSQIRVGLALDFTELYSRTSRILGGPVGQKFSPSVELIDAPPQATDIDRDTPNLR